MGHLCCLVPGVCGLGHQCGLVQWADEVVDLLCRTDLFASSKNFAWKAELHQINKNIFKNRQFRKHQVHTIDFRPFLS